MFGEDKYQLDKSRRSGNAFVFGTFVYTTNDFTTILHQLSHLYRTYAEYYGLDFQTTYVQITQPVIDFGVIPSSIILACIVSDHTINLRFDHIYLGGSFFYECAGILLQGTKPISCPPSCLSRVWSIFKLLYHYRSVFPDTNSTLPIDLDTPNSFYHQFDSDCLVGPESRRYKIIFKLLQDTLRKTDRPKLRAYITYGFPHTTKMKNNVGIFFVEIRDDTTLQDMVQQIQNNVYQVLATNTLMPYFQRGQTIRNSVDIVLTMGYVHTVGPSVIQNVMATFKT